MTKDYHHLCSAAPLPLPGLGDDDACHRSMTTFQPRGSSRFTGSSQNIRLLGAKSVWSHRRDATAIRGLLGPQNGLRATRKDIDLGGSTIPLPERFLIDLIPGSPAPPNFRRKPDLHRQAVNRLWEQLRQRSTHVDGILA